MVCATVYGNFFSQSTLKRSHQQSRAGVALRESFGLEQRRQIPVVDRIRTSKGWDFPGTLHHAMCLREYLQCISLGRSLPPNGLPLSRRLVRHTPHSYSA